MTRPLALITGGTSGIGLAVAKALLVRSDIAVVYGQDPTKAERAMGELAALKGDSQIAAFRQDLRQLETLHSLYEKVKTHFNKSPAILINAAGRIQDGFVQETKFVEKMSLLHEHLHASMLLCHLCLKAMSIAKWGRIINFSSISAHYAKRGQANYAAAKAGIEGFTQTLALEVAHRGITVNAIAPGLIATPMTEPLIARMEAEVNFNIRKQIPIGRVGTAEEVAALAAFLCSDIAGYITGTVVKIDGGRSLGDTRS